ncbi:DNA topoisomerase IV subunit B, partial [Bacillus sp. SIMBA_161]
YVHRDGKRHFIQFERGAVTKELGVIGEADKTGTTIRFKADSEIFKETTVYEFDILDHRLRELAYLNRGLKIVVADEREGLEQEKNYHYEGGIKSY